MGGLMKLYKRMDGAIKVCKIVDILMKLYKRIGNEIINYVRE